MANRHGKCQIRGAKRPLFPSQDAPFANRTDKEDEPQQGTELQVKQFGRKVKFTEVDFSRFWLCGPRRAVDDCVNGNQIGIGRLGIGLAKIEATPAFVNRRMLPSDFPLTGWALIAQQAAVRRASGDKAEIPNGPPDRALAKTGRAQPWPPVIQIIRADGLAVE